MERWLNVSKRINVIIGIGALFFLLCAPVQFVCAASGSDGDGSDKAVHSEQHSQTAAAAAARAKARGWAYLAAALATGLGSIGAGVAVGNVGAAAMGAVVEKPELMGKSLIYVALAEGIAIYGLLISILVLAKV